MGPAVWRDTQLIPDSELFRVSEAPSTDVLSQRDTHISVSEFPSFGVSEASSCYPLAGSKPEGPPNSRFPVLPSLEFPRTPPHGSTTNSLIPSVIPRAYVRREQIPEYTERFLVLL